MNRLPIFILIFLFPAFLIGQQTVRGTIIDQDSRTPIPFATIQLMDSLLNLGAVGDENGNFRLENVPLGKHNFFIQSVGYETSLLSNIEVTSGKEVVLNINLQESFAAIEEVVISAKANKSEAINEFATISARTLSMDEANRYAASIGDPARQALNFAGVASNGDDLENEIVVRGNSPRGLLWRLEGMEIPNPNHFATLGSSGGAVSMLSSNVLANSDFYSGAFPGEYGNALSGVFDLNYRKGNNERFENRFSMGFLGAELSSEGPIQKANGSSFLFNYRYSTLGILNSLGVRIAGDLLPVYQDLSFNVHLPSKKWGIFSIYGLGGTNVYEFKDDEGSSVYTETERANLGLIGLKHTYFLSQKSYLKTNINYSDQNSTYSYQESGANFQESGRETNNNPSYRISSLLNHKFNARNTAQIGLIWSRLRSKVKNDETADGQTEVIDNFDRQTNQIQSYLQWKWRLKENLSLNTGLHYMYYQFTEQHALEPRLGLRWQYSPKSALSIAGGLHSRAENLYAYALASENNDFMTSTSNLGLTKAAHVVLGHDWNINSHTRLKVEAYYQYLYDVLADASTNFTSINASNIFAFFDVNQINNDGFGRNYGVEFTLERFLHNNFYYLSTLSVFQSQYSINGQDYFNTRFNNNYIFNFLIGKDFLIGRNKQNTLGLNFKTTFLGGQRYTGLDESATLATGDLVYSPRPFQEQVPSYFRIDIGINYTFNVRNTTQRLSFNVQNVTNRLNQLEPDFDINFRSQQVIREFNTQNGIIPVLKYSIDF